MIDPLADTLVAAVQAGESTVASGGGALSWIEYVLARRPVWIAQKAAEEFARHTASTAPLWRWVTVAGPQREIVLRGTSMAATTSGAAGLAATMGIPIVATIGVWVMLGAGYHQARQEIRRKGFMSGFSQGFVSGVLNWYWEHTVQRFAMRFVVRRNAFDPVMDREEALGYNEGLIKGWGVGIGIPDLKALTTIKMVEDKKKAYRIALRRLANRHDDGPWSRNADEAKLQQVGYVIDLAAAGVRHGLIVAE